MINKQMDSFANYVGKNIVDIKTSLPRNTRIVKKDTLLSMDFDSSRLNLHVSNDGKVVKQTIG
jgi:hypothetical protein